MADAALAWVDAHPAAADALQRRLRDAAAAVPSGSPHAAPDELRRAALAALGRALDAMPAGRAAARGPDGLRPGAAELLLADALLTHAVAAAAAGGLDLSALRRTLTASLPPAEDP